MGERRLDLNGNPEEPDAAQRAACLVIVPTQLSESLFCLPALDALTDSGRRLVIPVAPPLEDLYALSPSRPDLLRLESTPAELVSRVRATGCPEAVVLDESLYAAWLTRSLEVPQRWGYAGTLRRFALSCPVRPPRFDDRHACDDFNELLEALGVAPPGPTAAPCLEISEDLSTRARERLERARVALEDPKIGIVAGVSGSATSAGRPWPRTRFEELARQLRRQVPRRHFVLLATPEDLWTHVRVHEETGKIHPVLGPDLSLDVLAGVLAELDLVIGNDSWILQLAAAVRTPTLGLFTGDPSRWAPRGPEHRILARPRLVAIEAAEVAEVAEEMMA